jgi:hypothetical protein
MDTEILKALGQGGLAASLLGLIWLVGNRMVKSIDRMDSRIHEHTKADTEALMSLNTSIVRLEGKLDGALDERERTPVGVPMPRRLHGRRNDGNGED